MMKNIRFVINKNSKGFRITIVSSNGNKFNHAYNRKQSARKAIGSLIKHIHEGYYEVEDKT